MGRELVGGGYIQADETTVGVQMHDKRGKNHQAYLWQYGTPGGSVIFDFQMGRSREGPKDFLGRFEGILQTDGYTAYDRTGGPKMVHAACWAHARRRVFDALKLNPDDRVARQLVERTDALFLIDAEARNAGMDHAARHALRHQRSLARHHQGRDEVSPGSRAACQCAGKGGQLHAVALAQTDQVPGTSRIGAEQQLGGELDALGRKNWMHVGSEEAEPKVAAILSVIESCRRLKLSVRQYLASILPGLADRPVQRVGEYTPAAWAASRL